MYYRAPNKVGVVQAQTRRFSGVSLIKFAYVWRLAIGLAFVVAYIVASFVMNVAQSNFMLDRNTLINNVCGLRAFIVSSVSIITYSSRVASRFVGATSLVPRKQCSDTLCSSTCKSISRRSPV